MESAGPRAIYGEDLAADRLAQPDSQHPGEIRPDPATRVHRLARRAA